MIDGASNDAPEPTRYVEVRFDIIGALAALVREPQIRQTARVHRVRPGDHPIEQHAQAVDVALNGRIAAAKQLRCKVKGRTRERGQGGRCAHELTTGAEVHQDRASVDGKHHVLSFDVTVQKTGFVNRSNRVTDLDPDLNCDRRLQRRLP